MEIMGEKSDLKLNYLSLREDKRLVCEEGEGGVGVIGDVLLHSSLTSSRCLRHLSWFLHIWVWVPLDPLSA